MKILPCTSWDLTSKKEIENFLHYIICDLHINFHPDNDFKEYGLFSDEHADLYNDYIDSAFAWCSENCIDFYELAFKVLTKAIVEKI